MIESSAAEEIGGLSGHIAACFEFNRPEPNGGILVAQTPVHAFLQPIPVRSVGIPICPVNPPSRLEVAKCIQSVVKQEDLTYYLYCVMNKEMPLRKNATKPEILEKK